MELGLGQKEGQELTEPLACSRHCAERRPAATGLWPTILGEALTSGCLLANQPSRQPLSLLLKPCSRNEEGTVPTSLRKPPLPASWEGTYTPKQTVFLYLTLHAQTWAKHREGPAHSRLQSPLKLLPPDSHSLVQPLGCALNKRRCD